MRRPLVLAAVGLVAVAVALVAVLAMGDDPGAREGADEQLPAVSAEDGVSEGETPAEADVVVMGDSVTDRSSERIVEAMPDREMSVIGLSGYRTDEILPTVTDALGGDGRPAVAVFMAGYNDLWQRTEREAPVEEIAELLGGIDCGVWVLVPTKGPWDRGRAEELETRIRSAAEAVGVVVETGWRDAVDAGDGPDPDASLVSSDHVHPTGAGRRKVAEVMAAAVDRACP